MYSVLKNFWVTQELDDDFINKISQKFDLNDLISKLISIRVKSIDGVDNFIKPKIKNTLPHPFSLLDMENAVTRTIDAIEREEKICVFADYDVDGATSAALLKNIFRALGVDVQIYIPDRVKEGYGPNTKAVSKIKNFPTDLMITLDCGSLSFEALEHASKIDLDVVVIDHHITESKLPKAVAVVNPNRYDEDSIYKNLAAVGVTFLFLVGLISKLKEKSFFSKKRKEVPNLMEQLDIVALGTICDVVALDPLNRAFVYQGLKIANNTNNIGYKSLCNVARVCSVKSYELCFLLGPRINSGGRVGDSSLGASLLSSISEEEAYSYAKALDGYNQHRKDIEQVVLQEAFIQAHKQQANDLLFIIGYNWHEGLIGIIAGRLKERYGKLSIVVTVSEQGAKGSCRSVYYLDVSQKIKEAKEQGLILSGGGHKMAAGFKTSESKLEALKRFFTNVLQRDHNSLDKKSLVTKKYDLEITLNTITKDFLSQIQKLEPYGNGNPVPVFRISNLDVVSAKIVGTNHISMYVTGTNYKGNLLNVIGFNLANTEISDIIFHKDKSQNISIIGTIFLKIWANKSYLQIEMKDVILP